MVGQLHSYYLSIGIFNYNGVECKLGQAGAFCRCSIPLCASPIFELGIRNLSSWIVQ